MRRCIVELAAIYLAAIPALSLARPYREQPMLLALSDTTQRPKLILYGIAGIHPELLLPTIPVKRVDPFRPATLASHPPAIPIPRCNPSYRRTFQILLSHPETTDVYDSLIAAHAKRHDLDPRLMKAIIAAESEFDRRARSPSGARGLMQLMSRTAEEMGIASRNLEDPQHNIAAGAAYLTQLHKQAWRKYKIKGLHFRQAPTWLTQRVIAAYNAGPRALGHKPWRPQTVHYVRKVMLYYRSPVSEIRNP